MSDPRVGVASANASLIVALSLQGHGFDAFRITDLSVLDTFDVALVDLAPAETLEVVRAAASRDVPCVVIGGQTNDVPGVRVILRPYSMAELVSTLQEALRTRSAGSEGNGGRKDPGLLTSDATDEMDKGAPSRVEAEEGSTPTSYERGLRRWGRRLFRKGTANGRLAPLSGAQANPSHGPANSIQLPLEGPSPGDNAPIHEHAHLEDPISRVESTAGTLQALLADAPFLKSAANFADGIAHALAAELHALNVGLWTSVEDELRLLGGVGLTSGERRMRPSTRHPLLERSRTAGGLVLQGTEMGALVHGIAGARTPVFAVALIEDTNVPVSVVTVGADASTPYLVHRVEAFIIETVAGWRAVQAVETLHRGLPA